MIEDLEALCDGLESFMAGTLGNDLRPSNASGKVLSSQPDEHSPVKFIQQDKSLTKSQNIALKQIG
jgi:hypothetical protein